MDKTGQNLLSYHGQNPLLLQRRGGVLSIQVLAGLEMGLKKAGSSHGSI